MTDLITQYRADASRLKSHLDDIDRQIHNCNDPDALLRLTRKRNIVEMEYFEVMRDIQDMMKYEKKG